MRDMALARLPGGRRARYVAEQDERFAQFTQRREAARPTLDVAGWQEKHRGYPDRCINTLALFEQ